MAMTINTNIQSLNAQRNLGTSQSSLATSMQRLSSGLRVNSAKDDAAGLAIAERMNAQVRGMNVAVRNANDGISLSQTAEGALGKISENLQRMRELAVQASNDTNGTTDRTALDNEYKQLALENQRVIDNTKFNGQSLLTGTGGASGSFTFQVGANTSTDNQITINTSNIKTAMTTATQGSAASLGATAGSARDAIDAVDAALNEINSKRADFGAAQNRFDAVISNLQVASENAAAARGRIMDADFASETSNLSRSQILQQAGTAMVAQANQLPQGVLSLLR
ncbi:MAG: flagellin FliC [Comamonas sp.]|jgi:flagellin|uniref:flagellin domain-containing protein n=1 Tax=Comamonas sp. TaxID=34028 RepID=UPI0028282A5D|nr:flagellin domain-containing protein [Comamonas sp.]MDR0213277.1 flagellin FliC [Comamonas sp.]